MKSYKTTRPTTGEFQIITPRNSYWMRLRQGIICDCAPALRNYFLYMEVDRLLGSIYRREGRYEVRQIVRG